jgi:hypothetical protein
MKHTIEKLQEIISAYTPKLYAIDQQIFSAKPRPEKWSRKEIMGHLIDSAQNNARRFVVAQYEDVPRIVYRQDDWVAISNYQHYPSEDLIALWALFNKHICIILANTSAETAKKTCAINDPEPHTIAWLAEDYVKHLLHHLHQVLDLEPLPYP